MNIRTALDVSQRSVSFREAEIFLQHVLGVDRGYLHAHPETELTEAQTAAYEQCLRRREANEPVAYITGSKEFYGHPFKTDKRALIPRPETEALVTRALEILDSRQGSQRILEIGTGSGNIAVTLALELHDDTMIIATDVDPEAVALAGENYALLSATQPALPVRFLVANMFAHREIEANGPYDLVLANLPYVPDAWRFDAAAQPEVVFQEPALALFGGEDGLDHYRAFFEKVASFAKPDATILVEYGEDETGDITDFVRGVMPSARLAVHKDYAGLDRLLEITL